MDVFNGNYLTEYGLNLQSIVNLSELPLALFDELAECCPQINRFSQLILVGHAGKQLWESINQSNIQSENPVDEFSQQKVMELIEQQVSIKNYQIIYPGTNFSGLQKLGELLGWQHRSPFAVGINQPWGSWFAYRVLILTDSHFTVTPVWAGESPCLGCQKMDCIRVCPANAVSHNKFKLNDCLSYRKSVISNCKDRCLARMACPVASQHQYSLEQIKYHYLSSMKIIETLKL